jgi:hypothetical protein
MAWMSGVLLRMAVIQARLLSLGALGRIEPMRTTMTTLLQASQHRPLLRMGAGLWPNPSTGPRHREQEEEETIVCVGMGE